MQGPYFTVVHCWWGFASHSEEEWVQEGEVGQTEGVFEVFQILDWDSLAHILW